MGKFQLLLSADHTEREFDPPSDDRHFRRWWCGSGTTAANVSVTARTRKEPSLGRSCMWPGPTTTSQGPLTEEFKVRMDECANKY
jgi:hypothetical protein